MKKYFFSFFRSASNFQDSIYDATPSSHYQFFTLVFLSWDYTMTDEISAKLKLKSLKKQIIVSHYMLANIIYSVSNKYCSSLNYLFICLHTHGKLNLLGFSNG